MGIMLIMVIKVTTITTIMIVIIIKKIMIIINASYELSITDFSCFP